MLTFNIALLENIKFFLELTTSNDVSVRKRGGACQRERLPLEIEPKMSTLLCHPLEIDCITFKKLAPRIKRDALFQERRW